MPGATLGTWNTNFRDSDNQVAANVGVFLSRCQAGVLTEARSEGVDTALAAAGWSEHRTDGSSDRIVWDPDLWRPRGPHGAVEVHGPGPGKFLPAREVSWVTLEHRASGTLHLLMASHVTAGYTSPEDLPHDAWRDRAAKAHLLAIVEHSARLIGLDGSRSSDYHHLLGDLNGKPSRVAAWWYPVRLLDSLWVPDDQAGLDWLAHSRAASERGLRVQRRWTEPLGSEGFHPAHYKRVTFPRP